MFRSVLDALPDILEWSGDPARCPGVVGRHSGYPIVVRNPSRISGSGQEAIPDVRECSRCPPEYLDMVGRPSPMSGSCREALANVREWSAGPHV